MQRISGILVGPRQAMESTGGGVQQASREYLATLQLAGWDLRVISFDVQASLRARLANRIVPRVMAMEKPCDLEAQIEKQVRNVDAGFVFYFANIFPGILRCVRSKLPDTQQVLLSAGIESLDFCIEQQIRRRARIENRSKRKAYRMLGQQIMEETEQRSLIDAVIAMSLLEAEVEKWLGAPRVMWLPRTIIETPLNPRPVEGRVGCVATLNHPPNMDGILRLLEQLRDVPEDFRFRLIGRPSVEGHRIMKQFSFVEYLGELDDAGLRAEASTWCCFVHPLFVYAKGSSTKLAVGLGWGLPIATTKYGARGYYWDESTIPLATNPADLAASVLVNARLKNYESSRERVRIIVQHTPTLAAVSDRIRSFLLTREGKNEDHNSYW